MIITKMPNSKITFLLEISYLPKPVLLEFRRITRKLGTMCPQCPVLPPLYDTYCNAVSLIFINSDVARLYYHFVKLLSSMLLQPHFEEEGIINFTMDVVKKEWLSLHNSISFEDTIMDRDLKVLLSIGHLISHVLKSCITHSATIYL